MLITHLLIMPIDIVYGSTDPYATTLYLLFVKRLLLWMMLVVYVWMYKFESHYAITLDELRVLLFVRDSGEWDKLDEMHISVSTFLFNANL